MPSKPKSENEGFERPTEAFWFPNALPELLVDKSGEIVPENFDRYCYGALVPDPEDPELTICCKGKGKDLWERGTLTGQHKLLGKGTAFVCSQGWKNFQGVPKWRNAVLGQMESDLSKADKRLTDKLLSSLDSEWNESVYRRFKMVRALIRWARGGSKAEEEAKYFSEGRWDLSSAELSRGLDADFPDLHRGGTSELPDDSSASGPPIFDDLETFGLAPSSSADSTQSGRGSPTSCRGLRPPGTIDGEHDSDMDADGEDEWT